MSGGAVCGQEALRKRFVPWNRHKLPTALRAVIEAFEARLLLSGLPTGWSDNDVGSPPIPGSASYTSANNTNGDGNPFVNGDTIFMGETYNAAAGTLQYFAQNITTG